MASDGCQEANFLKRYYLQNYFSHIIIDEYHRSAWHKWLEILKANPDAMQIGRTATPRKPVDANTASQ